MSGNNKSVLTPEQIARIEANKRQALEKLRAKHLKSIQQTPEIAQNPVTKILPTKTLSSHRVNPYLKTSGSSNIYQKPQGSHTGSKNNSSNAQRLVKCTIELVNDERFQVKTNIYDEKVIQEFRKISSKIYHGSTKNWSFNISDYSQLIKALTSLSNVTCNKIPEFVIRNISKKTEVVDELCLDQIESTLISTLIDFQRSGICFGISKKGRCMIADDMGLGKSRQAIGIVDFYKEDWPLLVITNASTRQFWAKEIENLLPYLTFKDIHIIQGTRDCFDNAKVVICSYSNLQGGIEDLIKMNFGVIIFDESHNLKNMKAKQTINAEILSKNAMRIIMLTGTPALSRPVELYTQLKILDQKFSTFHQFTERYCNGKQTNFGWDASGSSNLEELNILLKKRFMIRRVKSDVFLELSAKNRKLVILENYEYTSKFDDEMQGFRSQFQDQKDINNKDTEEILLKWHQTTSQVKAFGASVFVKKYLQENDCKILVFAHHSFMMNVLCTELEKAQIPYIRIDGTVRGDIRANRVEDFQTNPHIRAAVLSIRACNAGITLTAASTVIFCEFDWNPSTIIQAESRAHRIGQENEVKIYFLLANKTSDDIIWKLLQEKQSKLGKAGLVANAENLGDNISVLNFDVQQGKIQDELKINNNNDPNDYFDDIDDEEFLKLVENLP